MIFLVDRNGLIVAVSVRTIITCDDRTWRLFMLHNVMCSTMAEASAVSNERRRRGIPF